MIISVRSNAGFSVLEVMVAFGILAIGMLGVGTMLTTSMKEDQYATQTRFGDFAAMDEIELLKADSVDAPPESDSISPFKHDGRDTAVYYRVDVTADNPSTQLDRIDITVGWGGTNCKSSINNCKYKSTVTNFVPRSGL